MRQHKTILLLAVALVAALVIQPVAAQAKNHTSIKYPKLPDFEITKPETLTLSNGMKVFLMEDHELPLISASIRIRTGSNHDPADKVGLGDIFGQIMREGGTTSMSGEEIDEYLALRAASVETGMGGDVGFASANSLVENFDDTFAVLADVLRNPIFAEDKLEVAKSQSKSAISRRNDDIAGITGREFSRIIYGPDSPLGRLVEYETLANIERDDLLAWHKKYYHPNNTWIGIVGDFDPAEMKRKIEREFGDWARGPELKKTEVAYESTMKPGVYFIEKDDVTQAYVRLGHLGMETRDTPDYYAVQVMNEVLGGSFASRLFSNVRSQKGLAYSVFGGVGSSFMRPGVFQVGLSTKSETMAESVDALKEEINGIINDPPSKEELDRAKESILNSFVFRYDSKDEILGQLMVYDYYGMPDDFLDSYRGKIEKISTDDVARVAKKYVHPDKLALLVVGKAEDFDQPVASFGKVDTVDIAIAPPPDTQPKVQRSAANLAAGTELFSKMVAKLTRNVTEKFQSMKSDYTMAVSMGGQKMSMGQESVLELPNKLRTTLKTPMGNQTIVLNDGEGFMSAGGQTQPLPGEMVKEQMQDVGRELLVLSSNLGNPDLEAIAAGTDEVDGKPCNVIAVTFRDAESRLCVDAEGVVVRQTYQGKHPMQRTPGTMEVLFSDYSEVDGYMIPHTQVVSFEGQELATLTLNSIEMNPQIDPSAFQKPN